MTVFRSNKFPVLSLSLHKSVSISVWTSLLTCPEDVQLLQLYSRVGKPDVQFLRCGSCSVPEVNRYFEIPEGLFRLNSHGYYIQFTVCTSDKKVMTITQIFIDVIYLLFINIFIYPYVTKLSESRRIIIEKEFGIIH
jgi:hypothetical protein